MLKILLLKIAGSQLRSSSSHLAFSLSFIIQILTRLEQIAVSVSPIHMPVHSNLASVSSPPPPLLIAGLPITSFFFS